MLMWWTSFPFSEIYLICEPNCFCLFVCFLHIYSCSDFKAKGNIKARNNLLYCPSCLGWVSTLLQNEIKKQFLVIGKKFNISWEYNRCMRWSVLTWVFKAGTLQNFLCAALPLWYTVLWTVLLCLPQLKESAAFLLDSHSLDVTWKLFKGSKSSPCYSML